MKILYAAIDQTVPGTKGGSVHVSAVAEGLARLGHEVTALVTPGPGLAGSASPVRWIPLATPLGSPHLRLLRARAIATLARGLRPDVIVERYHNFGGEAIRSARALGAVGVLEVNAPVVDHAGSRKALLDRLLLVQPMRRWREHLCRIADVIVSPEPATIPAFAAGKLARLEWGADIDRFRPDAPGPAPYARPGVTTLAVFAGAFRSWHGAIHLVEAIKVLRARGRHDIGAVLIGDGPELPRVREAAAGIESIVFTGALSHHQMPAALAGADVGVAPFDAGAHAPLALGFYWSPLKIFEYMASGLPVVAPGIDRIRSLVADGIEGVLYPPAHHADGVAEALARLADAGTRRTMGAAARERAVREYSWDAHCRALVSAIEPHRRVARP